MAVYLLKTEPGDYSYDDLVRDRKTHWDGVANPAAQMAMKPPPPSTITRVVMSLSPLLMLSARPKKNIEWSSPHSLARRIVRRTRGTAET